MTDPEPASRSQDRPRLHWDTGALMVVVGMACFATAVGYDTRIQSSFDLSKVAVLYLMAMLLLVGFMTKMLATAELRVARTPLDGPVLATLAAVALSTAFSVDWRCSVFGAYKTYEGAIQFVVYVAFFYAAARLRRGEVVVVLAIILAAALGAGAYGLVQRLGRDPLMWSKNISGRMISVFGNPVFFGAYVAIAAPLGMGLFLRGRRGKGGGLADAALWLAALAATVLFCGLLYPGLQRSGRTVVPSGMRILALLAASAGICIALGWRQFFRRQPSCWPTALGWIGLALAVAANLSFYCSRTVGVLVALAVGYGFFIVYMFHLHPASFRIDARKWLLLIAGLMLALNVALNLWSETSTVSRLSELLRPGRPAPTQAAKAKPAAPKTRAKGSFYKRLLLWHSALNIFRARPLTGVGPDAIERVIATYWAADWQRERGELVQVQGFENRIHNEWLDLAASQGIVGLAARAWLYLAFLALLLKSRNRVSEGDWPVLAGLGAAWAVYVAQNIFEFPTIPLSVMSWTLMGCTVAWVQNGDDPGRWPTRRVRLFRAPNAPVAVAGLVVTGLVLGAFWVQCLWQPYRADRQYMAGFTHLRSRQPGLAVRAFERAVARQPRSHVYREQLCMTLVQVVGQVRRSPLPIAKKASELLKLAGQIVQYAREGTVYSSWSARTRALLATGQELLARALAMRARPGDQAVRARAREQATANFRQAVKMNPYNIDYRKRLALDCIRGGRWDELAAIMAETIRWWPRDRQMPKVLMIAARTRLQAGRAAEAEQLVQRMARLLHEANQGYVHECRARIDMARRRWKDMADEIRLALQHWPAREPTPGVLSTAVQLLAKTHQLDQAAQVLARVEDGAPARFKAALLANWVRVRVAQENWPALAETASRMMQCKPRPPHAHHALAVAYMKLGRLEEAKRVIDDLLRGRPTDQRGLQLKAELERLLSAGHGRPRP